MDISIDKLKAIEGQTLSLPQICQELDIPYQKGGNGRTALIKEIGLYCVLESQGRKYVITNVHNRDLDPIYGGNKFQIFIEQAVLHILKANNYNPIYLSKAEILEQIGVVNHNFKIAKSIDALRVLGNEYYYLQDASSDAANIFYPWIKARLQQMQKRSLIYVSDAIRLIKIKVYNGKTYYLKENLEKFSEKEKEAMAAISRARASSLPLEIQQMAWIPPKFYYKYEKALRQELIQTFGPEYLMAYKIILLQSSKTSVDLGLQYCRQILNKESTRKIRSTRRLDYLTDTQRRKFTEEIIDLSTNVNYSKMLEDRRKKK